MPRRRQQMITIRNPATKARGEYARGVVAYTKQENLIRGVEYYQQHPDEGEAYLRAWEAERARLCAVTGADLLPPLTTHDEARREAFAEGDLARRDRVRIFGAYRHCCQYCGGYATTLDHITPIAHGGRHTLWNVVPACSPCNRRKMTSGPLRPVQPLLLL
jgi:5-methylcytosine-specific restriction endonuclease McrA